MLKFKLCSQTYQVIYGFAFRKHMLSTFYNCLRCTHCDLVRELSRLYSYRTFLFLGFPLFWYFLRTDLHSSRLLSSTLTYPSSRICSIHVFPPKQILKYRILCCRVTYRSFAKLITIPRAFVNLI